MACARSQILRASIHGAVLEVMVGPLTGKVVVVTRSCHGIALSFGSDWYATKFLIGTDHLDIDRAAESAVDRPTTTITTGKMLLLLFIGCWQWW